MNWESIGAISEVVGAVAVVVSIVYLALQIKSNTNAVRANAGFEATHSWASSNELIATLPDEHLTLIQRIYDPNESWEAFSDLERMRISLFLRALVQKLEGQYYLYRYEQLDEGLWKNRSTFVSGALTLPFFEKWWSIEKQLLVYSDEFVSAIESVQPMSINTVQLVGKNRPTDSTP